MPFPVWYHSIPASLVTLEYFCAHAGIRTSLTQDIKSVSIQLTYVEQGLPDPTESTTLQLICRLGGIRRQQGDNQRIRLPIAINLLRTLKNNYDFPTTYYIMLEQRMLWAVFTVAFYGFFRASEFLKSLHWSDIALSTTKMSVTLCTSV